MALTKVSGSVLKDPLSLGGEVSIGGTLTYQDVTNVDAIGIITARAGVNVSSGEIVVGSNIKIGNAGIITASGLDISGDIDVDGHTNLDNVSIAGVSTFASNLIVNGGISADTTLYVGSNLTITDKILHDGDTDTVIRFPANDTFTVETAGTERLRIDSSGRLGVGVNSFHDTSTRLQLQSPGSDHTGIVITAAATSTLSYIYFGDTADKDIGRLVYENSSDSMQFWTNNAERLRIDSSGDMTFQNSSTSSTVDLSSIIFANGNGEVAKIRGETRNGNNYGMITFHNHVNGTSAEKFRLNHDGGFCYGTNSSRTAEFTQPDGFSIRYDDKGQFQTSVTNTTCGLINRKGSDGDILSFRKDGTGVGHIGVNASTMYFNFGGTTAAAHQLDDYEEGYFQPTLDAPNQSSTGFTIFHNHGYYTKIGNIVTVTVYIQGYASSNASGGSNDDIKIINLPFAPAVLPGSGSSNRHAANWTFGTTYKVEVDRLEGYTYGGNTYIDLLVPSNGGTGTMLKSNQINQNTCQFWCTATYRV